MSIPFVSQWLKDAAPETYASVLDNPVYTARNAGWEWEAGWTVP
jgi:hypothetical protein